MVLLFQRFGHHTDKNSSKMKQQHESSESLSTCLETFESEILNHLYQLSLHSKPGSDIYSFSWIQSCLRVLPNVEKAFAKFIVEIDYPVTKWKSSLVEEYLKDNSSLLDHFNCLSSSINHMSQVCMKLLHALSLVEASPTMLKNLQEILPWSSKKRFEDGEEEGQMLCSEKELIVHRALLIRKRVKNWICRIVDASIRGDVGQSWFETKNKGVGLYNSSLISLQFSVCEEMKRKGVVKDVSDINRGVVQLLAPATEGREGDEANKLRGRVEELGKLLEGIKVDVNSLFSAALVRRNKLVDSLQSSP